MTAESWLQSVAAWVLWNSSGAAILVVLLLCVRLLCGRAMSARLRSRLWLLVAARLLIPTLPAISLPNRLAVVQSIPLPVVAKPTPIVLESQTETEIVQPTVIHPSKRPQFEIVEDGMAPAAVALAPKAHIAVTRPPHPTATTSIQAKTPINWWAVALIVWLSVAAIFILQLLVSSFRLWRQTRSLKRVDDPEIDRLLIACCGLMGIKHPPMVLSSKDGSAPALVGVIRSKILLPRSLSRQLSHDEIRLVFLHELAHLRRRDVLANYVFRLLVAIHWFNPLIWLACSRMAADRELACDEAVLAVTSRRHARSYGCTILKLVELLNSQRLPAGAVGVVQNKSLIQRRIDMIASYPSRAAQSPFIVRATALSLAIAFGVSVIRAQSAAPVPAAMPPAISSNQAVEAAPAAVSPPSIPAARSYERAPGMPGAGVGPVDARFFPEEIEPFSPRMARLMSALDEAKHAVERLKQQGLSGESKPMEIAEDTLRAREAEVKAYGDQWNDRYTAQIHSDGTSSAVPKPSEIAATNAAPMTAAPGAMPQATPPVPAALPAPGAPMAPPAPATPSAQLAPPAPLAPVAPEALPGALPPSAGTPVAPIPAGLPGAGIETAPAGMGASADALPRTADPLRPPEVPSARFGGMSEASPAPSPMQSARFTRSVEDAGARQANLQVMQKLQTVHPLSASGVSLRDVLSQIADVSGVDIVIDENVLKHAGVDLDGEPISMNVKAKPVEQLLSLVLRVSSAQLDYSIYNGVVFVSTRDALSHRLVTRVFDIPDSANHDALRRMISSAVDGNAECNVFDKKAVITAPEAEQRDIYRLLSQFDAPKDGPRASATFFLYRPATAKASEIAEKFPKELGKATVEDRTNSLLVSSPNVEAARAKLKEIDSNQVARAQQMIQTQIDQAEIPLQEAASTSQQAK